MNRLLTLFILSLVLMVTACDQTEKVSGKQGAENEKDHIYEWRVSAISPEEFPDVQNLIEFKEEVETKTDGRIKLDVYPANQLGDYTAVYEDIINGTIEMALQPLPSQFDSRLELLFVHYLVNNYEEAKELFAPGSYVFNKLEEINEELGVKFLGVHVAGLGGVGTIKELKEPEIPGVDKGALIRVPSIDLYNQTALDLGFRTVSIPYSEVFQALQTGIADGWVGGPPVAQYSETRDVINYYYHYQNLVEAAPLIMSLDIWSELSEEDKNVLTEAANNLTIRGIETAEENDNFYMEELRKEGIEVIEFSAEELKEISEYSRRESWPKMEERLGADIVNELLEIYNIE